jgi:hypothetical protein
MKVEDDDEEEDEYERGERVAGTQERQYPCLPRSKP